MIKLNGSENSGCRLLVDKPWMPMQVHVNIKKKAWIKTWIGVKQLLDESSVAAIGNVVKKL